MSEILNAVTSRCSSTNIPSIITFFPGATQQVWSDLSDCACNSCPQIINICRQTYKIFICNKLPHVNV